MKTIKEYISTAEGMDQMYEKIGEILDNFDFPKVVKVMEALNWFWVCSEEEAHEYLERGLKVAGGNDGLGYQFLPDTQSLIKFARKFILDTIKSMPENETIWRSETGGFMVEVFIFKNDEDRKEYYGEETEDDFKHSVDITLRFVVEEWETY